MINQLTIKRNYYKSKTKILGTKKSPLRGSLEVFLIYLLLFNFQLLTAENKIFIVEPAVEKQWNNMGLSNVRLLDGSDFKTMQDIHLNYLLKLEPERLMNNVLRGGDIPTTAQNYGGWQHDHGNGFSNYLSGCSMMYASTGDGRLLERIKWMVDHIADCQEKENLDGYFYFSREKGAESYNQLMRASNNNVNPNNNGGDFYTNPAMAGMSFYQLHRVFYGIRDVYYYTGYEKAKTVFIKCMEWACKWTDQISDDAKLQIALEAEHGGMTELFIDAYALTGNERFLRNADRWTHTLNFRDKVAEGHDVLTSRHGNVYDPKYIGLIHNYEYTGNEKNLDASVNVWDMVIENHTFPIGGHGRWERYGEPGKLLDQLANTSAETCCTNNMLRFSNSLFTLLGEAKYMDYYEQALYNHILSSKDPDNNTIGGGFCYYQSLMPGQCRKYMNDKSFYCCWETGLENHSKYGEAIYFENGKDLLINLYIPSTVDYKDKSFTLKMETQYPAKDEVKLTITEAGSFNGDILFRCPAWIDAGKVKVLINDKEQNITSKAGELVAVKSQWKRNDVIKIILPSELRYESSEEPNVGSLFYGPLVLATDLGNASNEYISNVWDQHGDTQLTLSPDFPNLDGPTGNLSSWIEKKAEGTLNFKTVGLSKNYDLLPYHKAHHRRTSIYQRFVSTRDVQRESKYVTDRILINVNEEEHQYSGRGAITGIAYNRYFRKGNPGNTFSYTVKVSSDAGVQHWVAVKYQGWETEDVGNYDVYIDDVKIGSENNTERARQFTFPTAFFKIPISLTQGKNEVKLQIRMNDKIMYFFGFSIVTDSYLAEWYPLSKEAFAKNPSIIRLEAEDAQPHGDNRTFDGLSSGGRHIARFTTYLQYKDVFITESGNYSFTICYRSTQETRQVLTINGIEKEISCPATNEKWAVMNVNTEFVKGFNTIRLVPQSVRNPIDIDYFEISRGSTFHAETYTNDNDFFVYPNPAKDILFFDSSIMNWEGKVSVKDVAGRTLLSCNYPEKKSLALNKIQNGTYLVCFTKNDETNSTKLIINR